MTQQPPPPPPPATVLITTKNRKDDLRRAIASAAAQDIPVEVLVIDDGSTDGTAEMVRAEFPSVRLERAETSRGYIAQRNRGASIASAPVVFSIDDDAAFSTPSVVRRTLADFNHPRVGAVAIPYIDVLLNPAVRQLAPEATGVYVCAEYRGTAHAIRRDIFLALGGYREVLVHQTEEGDYCARMLEAGYVVRLGGADPIHHFESPKRDLSRQIAYNAQNHVLFAWHNAPRGAFPAHLAGTCVRILQHAARTRYLRASLRGIRQGFGAILSGRARRAPLSPASYRLYRQLRRRGPTPLASIESQLAPPTGPPPTPAA